MWILVLAVGFVLGGVLSIVHRTVGLILLAAIVTAVIAAARSEIPLALGAGAIAVVTMAWRARSSNFER